MALWGSSLAFPLPQQLPSTDVVPGPWEEPPASRCQPRQSVWWAAGLGSQAALGPQGRGTKHYGLIVVGHSLGAGTAAILSFLLRPQYPTLKCFAYSPPGGLLR